MFGQPWLKHVPPTFLTPHTRFCNCSEGRCIYIHGFCQPPPTRPFNLCHATRVYALHIRRETTLPLLQRLLKHDTTATTCAEDSSFHDLLRATGLSEWTPLSLQFTADENQAYFLERDWWFRLKRWIINDTAGAVPAESTSPAPPP